MRRQFVSREPGQLNYWAWGSADLLGAGAMAVVSGWLIYFLTTFCGLSAAEAGLILGIPRLVDAISCPLIGYLSDKLRHTWIGRKIGRRKVFLLAAIPLLPSFALMWVTGQNFTYYLVTFIFFEVIYASVLIPWETLPAEMTKDYSAKARFSGARILVGQASAILASYLPTPIIAMLGGSDSAETFLVMGSIFGVSFSLVVLIVVIFTWERPYSQDELSKPPERLSLTQGLLIPVHMVRDLMSTLRLRAFRQHLSIYLGGYISQDIFNAAFPLFVASVMLASTQTISQLMTVMYAFQLVSVMFAIQLVLRAGPVRAYRIGIGFFIAACLSYLVFYLARPSGFVEALQAVQGDILGGILAGTLPVAMLLWLFGPLALAGLGRGTLNYVPWSVYNYLPDIDEAVTGERREGIFAGVMTLVRKVAQSAALVATGYLIEAGGYVSGSPQQPQAALDTLVLIIVAAPVIVMLAGLALAWRFRLNAATHEVLVQEVERLREGHTTPATPESRAIVEDLTGWKYETLWGRRAGRGAPPGADGQGAVPPTPADKS